MEKIDAKPILKKSYTHILETISDLLLEKDMNKMN